MNATEYKEFQQDFDAGIKGLNYLSTGGCPGCEECGIEESAEEYCVEPHFSWSSCDICGSHLGGDRHPAHYCDDDGAINHLDICTDCLFYAEYGEIEGIEGEE